jgi:hypothetical protein
VTDHVLLLRKITFGVTALTFRALSTSGQVQLVVSLDGVLPHKHLRAAQRLRDQLLAHLRATCPVADATNLEFPHVQNRYDPEDD